MCIVIIDGVLASQTNCEIVIHGLIVEEILFDHLSAITKAKDKVTEAVVSVQLHDVPKDWFAANLNERFRTKLGFLPQSSAAATAQDYRFQGRFTFLVFYTAASC